MSLALGSMPTRATLILVCALHSRDRMAHLHVLDTQFHCLLFPRYFIRRRALCFAFGYPATVYFPRLWFFLMHGVCPKKKMDLVRSLLFQV
jgi:hypothetical protein